MDKLEQELEALQIQTLNFSAMCESVTVEIANYNEEYEDLKKQEREKKGAFLTAD